MLGAVVPTLATSACRCVTLGSQWRAALPDLMYFYTFSPLQSCLSSLSCCAAIRMGHAAEQGPAQLS